MTNIWAVALLSYYSLLISRTTWHKWPWKCTLMTLLHNEILKHQSLFYFFCPFISSLWVIFLVTWGREFCNICPVYHFITILLIFFFCHKKWEHQVCHSNLSVKLVGKKSSTGLCHTPLFTDMSFSHQASQNLLGVQREISITQNASFLSISEDFMLLMSAVS